MSLVIPSSTGSLVDGGLAILPTDTSAAHVKIGSSTLGVAGTIYSFLGTDSNAVVSTIGTGPGPDSVIDSLVKSNGKPVYFLKVTPSTAGSSSAVTNSGGGPTVTLTGTPNDATQSIVKIVLGGTVGTATFQYSLDNGDTWSPVITTASTYALSTGVTVNFAAGTYIAAATYSWTDTAPALTSSDITTALDTVIASTIPVSFVHIVGQPADAASLLTIATAVDGKMQTAFAAKRYLFTILEAPAVDKATLISAFPAFNSKFVVIAGGFCEYSNLRTGAVEKRSSGRALAGRIARTPISVAPSRLPDDSDLDPLSGVVQLVPSGAAASTGYHDEQATPGFTDARFASLRSLTGRNGFYITQVPTMAGSTSDYQRIQLLRIALQGCATFYTWSTKNLSARIRKDPSTGFISPATADALEIDARATLLDALKDHVDDLRVFLNRADNLSADPTLRAKIRFVGPAYADSITWEIGFAQALS